MNEKQKKNIFNLLFFSILLFIPLLFHCGEDSTGGVAFDIVWESASLTASTSSYQPQAPPSGVVTLRVTVSASDMDDLIKTFSDLNPAGGTIKVLGIKPGTNRSALVEGLDAGGVVTYNGTLSGITIEKGKITSAGTVTLSIINPTNSQNLPDAPGNLQASVMSSSQILLTWADNSDDETAFQVERKEGTPGSWGYVTEVTANVTSYLDAGLICEKGYGYRVRAYNGYGNSEYSNPVTKTTDTCPLSAPAASSNLAATVASASQINLTWTDGSNNEDGFKIERKTGTTGTYAQIGTVGSGVASYQDTGLDCGTAYYYRVRAFNGVGDSSNSNEANATTSTCPLNAPTAPSGLTAAVISSTQINIYWADNSSNETGFKIERKTGSSGTYSQVGTVGGGVKTYSDTGLTCGSTYYYRVRAYNTIGDSSYTSEANGVLTCSVTVPTAPSNLQATVVSSTQINLTWTDNSSNEDGFKVERKTGAAGTYAVVKTTSAGVTTYSDTGLTAGTAYYYRIYSYNSAGNSGYSSEANGTTSFQGWVEMGAGSASGGGISNNSGYSAFPRIIRGSDGNPIVAWHDNTYYATGNWEIYLKRWNGSAWVEMGTGSASNGGISNNWESSVSPAMVLGLDGNPVVAWVDNSGSYLEVYVKKWNGSAWVEMGTGSASGGGISNNSGESDVRALVLDSDGNPVVFWYDNTSGNYEIYVKKWNGSAWVEMGTGSSSGGGISDNTGGSGGPASVQGSDGYPIVTWGDNTSGDTEIYVKKWNGSGWVEMGTGSASGGGISDNSGGSNSPYPVQGSDGYPIVAWSDNSSGDYEIYVKRWNGSGWVEMGTGSSSGGGISDNTGSSTLPSTILGSDGYPIIFWQDDTSGDNEIYVKRWNGSAWVEMGTGSASGGGISDNAGSSEQPSIALGLDGNPVVTWWDNSSGDYEIYVKK